MAKQEISAKAEAPYSINLRQRGHSAPAAPIQTPCVKLLYGLRGTVHVNIGETAYVLSPGDLLLILPDEMHKIARSSHGEEAFWEITFSRDLLYSLSHAAKEDSFLFAFTTSGLLGQRQFERSMLAENSIAALLESLLEEYKDPGVCSGVSIGLYLCQLCLWFLRTWKDQDDEQTLQRANDVYSLAILQKVFSYVDQEYMNKVEMKTIANQLNMSYHSFSKFFILHTGKSFPGYVNEVRLAKSKILLATTGMNITEIAMEVGYISTSHFIQRFKESNQMTPQQFRKEFNK